MSGPDDGFKYLGGVLVAAAAATAGVGGRSSRFLPCPRAAHGGMNLREGRGLRGNPKVASVSPCPNGGFVGRTPFRRCGGECRRRKKRGGQELARRTACISARYPPLTLLFSSQQVSLAVPDVLQRMSPLPLPLAPPSTTGAGRAWGSPRLTRKARTRTDWGLRGPVTATVHVPEDGTGVKWAAAPFVVLFHAADVPSSFSSTQKGVEAHGCGLQP